MGSSEKAFLTRRHFSGILSALRELCGLRGPSREQEQHVRCEHTQRIPGRVWNPVIDR